MRSVRDASREIQYQVEREILNFVNSGNRIYRQDDAKWPQGNRFRDLYAGFEAVAAETGVEVTSDDSHYREQFGQAYVSTMAGVYDPPKKLIWVRETGHVNWRVKVLSHEVAHIFSFQFRKARYMVPYVGSYPRSSQTTSLWNIFQYDFSQEMEAVACKFVMELVAETASMLIMRNFGLDSSRWSIPYLTTNAIHAYNYRRYVYDETLHDEVEYVYDQVLDKFPHSWYNTRNGGAVGVRRASKGRRKAHSIESPV